MKIKHYGLLATLAATFFLVGCSTANLNTEYDKQTDFSNYKTFTLLPFPQHIQGATPGSSVGLANAAQGTLKDTLIASGYTEAPAGQADFAVGIRGQIMPKIRVKDFGYNYPTGARWNSAYPTYAPMQSISQYEEGTMIVEIFDAKTKELTWVGWSMVKRVEGAPINIERVQRGIKEILARFPPDAK